MPTLPARGGLDPGHPAPRCGGAGDGDVFDDGDDDDPRTKTGPRSTCLAFLLSHLDLLVTNDSGPMHLAAALGVPCVALFGPTDPRRTAPAGQGHHVLSTARWCAPCFRRRCPLLHHRCLRDLTVEQVAAACAEALAKRT